MMICFHKNAWEDYLHWQVSDKRILRKINNIIKDIVRNPYEGLGKPELLKHEYHGYWSRRIDKEHRLVYKIFDDMLIIAQCRFHY